AGRLGQLRPGRGVALGSIGHRLPRGRVGAWVQGAYVGAEPGVEAVDLRPPRVELLSLPTLPAAPPRQEIGSPAAQDGQPPEPPRTAFRAAAGSTATAIGASPISRRRASASTSDAASASGATYTGSPASAWRTPSIEEAFVAATGTGEPGIPGAALSARTSR